MELKIKYLNGTQEDVNIFQMVEIHRTRDNKKYIIVDGIPFWLGNISQIYLNKGKYSSLLNDLGNIASRLKGGEYRVYLTIED